MHEKTQDMTLSHTIPHDILIDKNLVAFSMSGFISLTIVMTVSVQDTHS